MTRPSYRLTLYNVLLRITRNLLVNRVIIKIKKKYQNGWLKKAEIFNSPSSQFFFAKISGIGLWVSTINWCKGHWCGSTYLVVRLSDIKGQFTVKNAILLFLALFWTDVRQPDDHIDWELGVLKISVCLSWSFDFFCFSAVYIMFYSSLRLPDLAHCLADIPQKSSRCYPLLCIVNTYIFITYFWYRQQT